MAAVIYMIAQQRRSLTTLEDGKLRGMTISEIERHGFAWERVNPNRRRALSARRATPRPPTRVRLDDGGEHDQTHK
jgi:hypothetical protein